MLLNRKCRLTPFTLFFKAFDTINHDGLLGKVWNARIRGSLFRWFKSYFIDRTLFVRTCGAESYSFRPASGVRQGSKLGSLLFCLFIFNWALINELKVNESGCNFLSFARGSLTLDNSYTIDNTTLGRIGSTRDLGVMITPVCHLPIRYDQISAVVKESLRIVGFIKNVSTLVHFYKSLLLPILTYCSSIPHTQSALDELIAIEHKFLKFVSKRTPVPMHFYDHDHTLIRSTLQLPPAPFKNIFLKNDYILAYKIVKRLFNSETKLLFVKIVYICPRIHLNNTCDCSFLIRIFNSSIPNETFF